VLRVLTYHRIADPNREPILNRVSVSANTATFAQQLLYLLANYRIVSMDEVLRAVQTGVPTPERSVLLTFDDAYRDFGEVAWPILKRYGTPVTLFVPTAFPGDSSQVFWWDRLFASIMSTLHTEVRLAGNALPLRSEKERYRAFHKIVVRIEDMPHDDGIETVAQICAKLHEPRSPAPMVLSWAELRALAREGVTLGAHTRRHTILTKLSPQQVRQEIVGCRQDLQREIGTFAPVFAYPSGRNDDRVVRVLREEGFVLGFTTIDGHNDLTSADPLRLCRTNISLRTSMPIFRLRLLRPVAYLDRWRHRYHRYKDRVIAA